MSQFVNDVTSFIQNHKYLGIGVLGIAIAVYAIGNLAGRVVSWMRGKNDQSQKIDDIFKGSVDKKNDEINKVNSTPEVKIIMPSTGGEYPLLDISPLDDMILFNGRRLVNKNEGKLSDWQIGDKLILKQDEQQNQGFYKIKNTRLDREFYFSPFGGGNPTIRGFNQIITEKTERIGRIEKLEGNSVYLDENETSIMILAPCPNWKVGDEIRVIRNIRNNRLSLKNTTRRETMVTI